MGQKWFETLLVKAKSPEDEVKKPKQRKNRRKWKFWKSSVHASDEKQEVIPRRNENYGTEEWAAIVIQTAFRVFLARRAFRAIKGIVRLQALVRGRKVRKQASITLRCMQTLVKVHSGVRARQAKMLSEVSAARLKAEQAELLKTIDLKGSDSAWLNSVWTKEELVNRIQEKQKAAVKRERALNYACTHQWRAHTRPASEQSTLEWGWLERWMAARPWENQVVEEVLKNGLTSAPKSTDSPKKQPIEVMESPKKITTTKTESLEPAKKNGTTFETPKKVITKAAAETMDKRNGSVEPLKKVATKAESFDSPKKKSETPKKSFESPNKNGLTSPLKAGKSSHRESDSFDSPKSVQSNSSKLSPQVTPTKVVNGVLKPVVKSRYMNPRQVPRAESAPRQRPSLDELEAQKKRLSLPTPRAKDLPNSNATATICIA